MNTKTTAQHLAEAREVMQHLIRDNSASPMREQHERLINNLKDQLMKETKI